ncbi:MAG: MerC domain-containing protein [Bacteroidetes bacterium]|nr:MerC domain-containing protein [Bacteroidota bacterium]
MKLHINWDALGIGASLACAIHCALLPLFLSSLPLFGINIINNIAFEVGMIVLAFCIGAWSFFHGYRRHHHSPAPFLIFAAGFSLLVFKQVFHEHQLWLLIPGVMLIITAHISNYRSCRLHNHAHADDCNH